MMLNRSANRCQWFLRHGRRSLVHTGVRRTIRLSYMSWVKIPKENHPLFLAALPTDRRVVTLAMFGGIAGLVNGNMFGGLFGRSAIVKLDDADYAEAMKLD